MLFNSAEFIFAFFPLTLLLFYLANRYVGKMGAVWVLLGASLTFYVHWSVKHLFLLLGSVLFNFIMGYYINRVAQKRKFLMLATAISVNLLLLFYFKYFNFFMTTIGSTHIKNIVLPLGISFFTFTQIAYLVDIYKGELKDFSLLRYTLFITYFPHLIAGPIIHHKEVMPQFSRSMRFDMKCINVGIMIFFVGLIKKVIFADNLALLCDPIFLKSLDGGQIGFLEGWVGALAYTFQLYFDFSGYCDMAIGLSYAFGIKLPINFYSPYKALNIIDFWRRWHITLSRFLRDYVYIPLGGSRHGHARRFINLFATMFIGGIWHGAGWTFVIWGALHGFYLIVNHGWLLVKERIRIVLPKSIVTTLSWTLTFIAVVVAWVFFRAKTLVSAKSMLGGMFGTNGFHVDHALLGSAVLLLGFIVFVVTLPNTQEIFRRYDPALWVTKAKNTYQNWDFAKLFTRFLGNPLLKRGVPSTIFVYSMISYTAMIILFGLGFYQFELDKKVYAALPNKNNHSYIDNTKGSFRNNLYSHYILSKQFKDYHKIIVLGSSYTTNMSPKTFTIHGERYISGSLGIGGNSLLNGFRTAFSIMDEPGIKTIIFAVSPLGYGKISQDSVAFNDEGLEWIKTISKDNPHVHRDHLALCHQLDVKGFCKIYFGKDHHLPTFLDYLQHELLAANNAPDPQVTITLDNSLNQIKTIKSLVKNMPVKPVQNQANGADETFHWESRGIVESMQATGDVYTLFKHLNTELQKRSIKLVVYETPTPKHDIAPHVYPRDFFENYQKHATQMFAELGIHYFDLSDFLPWQDQFMVDFIHAQNPSRNVIHQHVLN
nr:MBOAT family protein [Pseudomonadota bacterium]